MNDREKVIKGLEYTKEMITFNPSTGEDIEPENLNEADKTTYDACVGAIFLLKEKKAEIERLKGEGKSPTWKKGKAFCGNCGGCLENKDRLSTYYVQSIRFCKWCGAPVDWSNE